MGKSRLTFFYSSKTVGLGTYTHPNISKSIAQQNPKMIFRSGKVALPNSAGMYNVEDESRLTQTHLDDCFPRHNRFYLFPAS